MTSSNPALSDILHQSSRCLAQVQSGRSLTLALAQAPQILRPAVQSVTWYAMRHWGLACAWRAQLLARQPDKPWLAAHLSLTLLLLDAAMQAHGQALAASLQTPLSEDCPSYTPHTLVDEAVKAVSLAKLGKPAKGLVNAVLRRFQREHDQWVAAVTNDLVARWNYPAWWIKKLQSDYPQDWQSILTASQVRPKLVLRVNSRQASVQQVVDAFDAAGIDCAAIGGQAVALAQSVAVQTLPGYALGWWSVQDWSAQQAANLLELKDGQRVLDACCAPGGKTAHILELADVDLTALDQDAERLCRVKENLNRLKLMNDRVKLKVADASDWQSWWDGKPYDVILADVPCTASGVVRRHPDIAWLRREADLTQTVTLQTQILDGLWHTLAPGAILLLVTCSVFPDEGEYQAQAFLARHADAMRLDAPGQCLPMASDEHGQVGDVGQVGHDGFFYAKFQRQPIRT